MIKIFSKILIVFIVFLIFAPQGVQAEQFSNLDKVFIEFDKVDWHTYKLKVKSNFDLNKIQKYSWDLGIQNFTGSDLREVKYVFEPGRYLIMLKTYDDQGNKLMDYIYLDVTFWSFYNTKLLWIVFGFLVLLIIYYWVAKLLYLFNKKRISRAVKNFFSFLDEHGWVEEVVAGVVRSRSVKDRD